LSYTGAQQMERTAEHTKRNSTRTLVKASILFAFIIVALYVYLVTPVKYFLTPETLGRFLEASGFWAPFIFILISIICICLLVPASLLVLLGAVVFGTQLGFVYGLAGAIGGASAAFFIGRFLGRDFVASFIGDRLKKYDEAIERNGFATVFYLRLINVPFTPLNFGMSLTKVHFWDYFFGTGLGVIGGVFILTFFAGTLREVWASGNWGALVSFKTLLALGLFIFSLFIPMLVKKIKGYA
jgi:uncharacterized membrane protein YdjX (TVP38/TMEM64 family)